MRRSGVRGLAGAAFVVALTASAALAVEVGEKAPELEPTAWARGEALTIEGAAGKHVIVVEFFTSFKPECVEALAAAAKLQDKWKEKGLEVVAVTVEAKAEVDKFLSKHESACRFAVDENHNTEMAYFGGVPYLPRAVVVDRAGLVVFVGAPDDGFEKLVGEVVEGKFDLAKTVEIRKLKESLNKAAEAEDESEEPPAEGESKRVREEAAKEAAKQRRAEVDAVCDKILALDPADSFALDRRVENFREADDLEGYRKFVAATAERLKDDPKSLVRIARESMGERKWNWRDPALAVTAARRAVEISKSEDAEILDAYADVLATIGLLDLAVDAQKKAVALEPKTESYARSLAFYQSCLAAKRRAKGSK
jgi:peroxiredoxin